jgi:hypothetical protein
MNKIKVLIDNGFITDDDIQQYISANQDHNEQEEFNDDWLDEPIIDTTYVLASTSDLVEETMVFPSNAEGEITSYSDLACLALRYGSDNWEDPMAAVIQLNTDEYKYIHVKTLDNGGNNIHNLFKRINTLETTVI